MAFSCSLRALEPRNVGNRHQVHARGCNFRNSSRVVCQAIKVDEARFRPVPAGLAAVAAAVALLGMPLQASAVSGGGGVSKGLAFEDMSNKDLTKLRLTKVDMRAANFSNSNLSGVSLFGCFAEKANFSGANLSNADLESGDFTKADFSNAVLEGAFANNANFKGTTITGSDWTDVLLRKDVQASLCASASGTNPTTGVDTRESLMCAP